MIGSASSERGTEARTTTPTIEPGKDHYVRAGGKLLGILLASQYPTEFDLEQARRDYERGVDGPVVLSSRRSGEVDAPGEGDHS